MQLQHLQDVNGALSAFITLSVLVPGPWFGASFFQLETLGGAPLVKQTNKQKNTGLPGMPLNQFAECSNGTM